MVTANYVCYCRALTKCTRMSKNKAIATYATGSVRVANFENRNE